MTATGCARKSDSGGANVTRQRTRQPLRRASCRAARNPCRPSTARRRWRRQDSRRAWSWFKPPKRPVHAGWQNAFPPAPNRRTTARNKAGCSPACCGKMESPRRSSRRGRSEVFGYQPPSTQTPKFVRTKNSSALAMAAKATREKLFRRRSQKPRQAMSAKLP